MLKVTLVHEMKCSEERFWEVFFDADFTRELILEGLDFASCEVDPFKEAPGDKRTRQMRVIPKIDVPAAVAKILGPKLGYTEDGTFEVKTERWNYELRLSVLSERIKMGGQVRIEAIDDTRCRRLSDLWVNVKIFGIGSLVERAAEKNMRDGWNRAAVWMNKWLVAHPPTKSATEAAHGEAP